jgi:hypothetical protein
MPNHIITVTFKNGEVRCNPSRQPVRPNETVQWKCDDGDLAVDIPDETPFTLTQVWRAPRGAPTPQATVKQNVRDGTLVRPTYSVDGAVPVRSSGDLETHNP